METFYQVLLVAASATVIVGLIVQMVGTVLFATLTVGVGVREWWVNR